MKTRVVYSQVEITDLGILQIRFEKQVVGDDGNVMARQYHRLTLDPGENLDEKMAHVNRHLEQMGFPPTEVAAVERVRAVVAVEHTPQRIAKFRTDQEAAAAARVKGIAFAKNIA